ncbi:MAG: Crp/Fnr family transcriptional regulator [Pyrinomonadaceae bacterium]
MTTDKIAILKQTELFRELDEGLIGELAKHSIEKKYERDELLFLIGDEARGLYVVATGAVRAFRTAFDGREQVIHVERAISIVAEVPLFDDGKYPSTVAAEEPTTVLFIAKNTVLDLCLKHPQIALAATRLLAARVRRCAELVEELSLREVGQRLAKFLHSTALRDGYESKQGISFELKITHSQLAARIGTVREVVSRSFMRLQEQMLISINGRTVTVPNIEKLSDYVLKRTVT